MKRHRLLAAAAAILSVIGLALVPSAASADPAADPGSGVGAAVCRPARQAFQYVYVASNGHLAVWHKECHGEYPLNSLGYIIQTRGWSGCVYLTKGKVIAFEPNKDIFIHARDASDRVFHITLFSTTDPPVCVDPAPGKPRPLAATTTSG